MIARCICNKNLQPAFFSPHCMDVVKLLSALLWEDHPSCGDFSMKIYSNRSALSNYICRIDRYRWTEWSDEKRETFSICVTLLDTVWLSVSLYLYLPIWILFKIYTFNFELLNGCWFYFQLMIWSMCRLCFLGGFFLQLVRF